MIVRAIQLGFSFRFPFSPTDIKMSWIRNRLAPALAFYLRTRETIRRLLSVSIFLENGKRAKKATLFVIAVGFRADVEGNENEERMLARNLLAPHATPLLTLKILFHNLAE